MNDLTYFQQKTTIKCIEKKRQYKLYRLNDQEYHHHQLRKQAKKLLDFTSKKNDLMNWLNSQN